MFKATELRIGNWIAMLSETSVSEDIYLTKQIKSGTEIDVIIRYLDNNIDNGLIAYKPIELTPELLQRFGFTKGNKADFYIEFTNSVGDLKQLYVGRDEGFFFWGIEEDSKSIPVEKINFLHHLQNIYYSLSGHELFPAH